MEYELSFSLSVDITATLEEFETLFDISSDHRSTHFQTNKK